MIQLAMIQRSGAANGPDAKLLSVCDSCYKGSWHASPRLCLCALCVRLGAQQRSVVLGWGGGWGGKWCREYSCNIHPHREGPDFINSDPTPSDRTRPCSAANLGSSQTFPPVWTRVIGDVVESDCLSSFCGNVASPDSWTRETFFLSIFRNFFYIY